MSDKIMALYFKVVESNLRCSSYRRICRYVDLLTVNPSGRAVQGVILRPLDAGIMGLKPAEGMYMRLFGACFVSNGLCDGRSLVQRSPTCRVLLIVCDLETSTMRRPRSELSCCATHTHTQSLLIITFLLNLRFRWLGVYRQQAKR